MKVLRILTRANLGGPARQLTALAPAFERLGVEETIAVGQVDAAETELALPSEAHVVEIKDLVRGVAPLRDRRARRALSRVIDELQPDVLHSHTAKAGLLAVRLGRSRGIPVVHSYHGHVLRDYFRPALARGLVHIERRLARARTALTCVSASCGRELEELSVLRPGSWTLVEPAVRPQELPSRSLLRAELGVDPAARAVAWCGRFEAVKDPLLFVQVARELTRHGVLVHAFGSGRLLEASRALAERIEAPIVWHGPDADFPRRVAAFDAVLSTSLREGYPVAAIEALLAAVPVIAPRVPGFVDLAANALDDGVHLVPREAAALATAVLAARPPSSATCQSLRALHDPGRIAALYAEIYARVVAT